MTNLKYTSNKTSNVKVLYPKQNPKIKSYGLDNKLYVSTDKGIHLIDVQDIIRIEASSNYSKLYLVNNVCILASKTLKHFDDKLFMDSFHRVHKSHIINLSKVKFIDGNVLDLEEGHSVPISRSSKAELMSIVSLLK